jgi:TPP-dependent pyruvate/acetoin dehydrogenase alpha subunit
MKKYKIIDSGRRVNELEENELIVLAEELIDFEDQIIKLWESAQVPYPIHFSGGNEKQLIEIFKEINRGDYVFSTHRSHYHYLLAGGSPERLERKIMQGKSMHIFDKDLNFLTSSIVAGTPAIAAGVAFALKEKKSKNKVWCFVGDGAEDEGHFYEAVRYVGGHNLPCKFVIEDNNRSVETPKIERYGNSEMVWPNCVARYSYSPVYPHVGTGKLVNFSKNNKSDGEVGGTLT